MRYAKSGNPLARAILFAAALVAASTSLAAAVNDCAAILPAAASAIGEPRLCRVNEDDGVFVCRAYRDDRRVYQVLFRGGTSPVAVYEHAGTDRQTDETVLQGTRRYVGARSCNLERPSGVSVGATYRGTGVCEDGQGRPLPCSLFEHAGARQPEAMRYFVYYEPDGSGIRRIDAVSAGRNERMLDAELAFQLGQSLANSSCCRDRARAYLAYAAALFPDDGVYRAALTSRFGEHVGTQNTPMAAFSRMLEQLR